MALTPEEKALQELRDYFRSLPAPNGSLTAEQWERVNEALHWHWHEGEAREELLRRYVDGGARAVIPLTDIANDILATVARRWNGRHAMASWLLHVEVHESELWKRLLGAAERAATTALSAYVDARADLDAAAAASREGRHSEAQRIRERGRPIEVSREQLRRLTGWSDDQIDTRVASGFLRRVGHSRYQVDRRARGARGVPYSADMNEIESRLAGDEEKNL